MKHIPNSITSLNLISGFAAIISASCGDLVTASWFILAAMIFDFCDGLSARLLKAYSDIGKELDSLADVVSFGVAPGFIIYQLLSASMSSRLLTVENTFTFKNILVFVIPAFMPVCGALRLAKFNIDTTQVKGFKGLPIPANALAVIAIILSFHFTQSPLLKSFISSPSALAVYTIILSVLMVTRIPLLSLKISNFRFRENAGRYILIGLVAIAFIICGPMALPLIIPIYLAASAISLLIR